MVRVLLVVLVAFVILCGCGQANSPVGKQEKESGAERADRTEAPQATPDPTTQTGTSADGGVSVGEAIARAELEPMGDSGTRGTAVLKAAGDLGVQI